MSVIDIKNLTKNYGNHKGVFDLSFSVEKGEVFGFLGPNGAGKTTTIRQLMGFIKPDAGECFISGLNCEFNSAEIQRNLGYLPGEIAFMDDMTGSDFIKFIAEMKGLSDLTKALELMKIFELDPSGNIKKMSKGMKQKLGIVLAFMQDTDILVLDEPSSGLDPLMQNRFIELVLKEKKRGKTILMSSHMFEEVERTCDRVGIIRDGILVKVDSIDDLKKSKLKSYVITLENDDMAIAFSKEDLHVNKVYRNRVTVTVQGDMSLFIKTMSKYNVINIEVVSKSLEELFMHYYGGDLK